MSREFNNLEPIRGALYSTAVLMPGKQKIDLRFFNYRSGEPNQRFEEWDSNKTYTWRDTNMVMAGWLPNPRQADINYLAVLPDFRDCPEEEIFIQAYRRVVEMIREVSMFTVELGARTYFREPARLVLANREAGPALARERRPIEKAEDLGEDAQIQDKWYRVGLKKSELPEEVARRWGRDGLIPLHIPTLQQFTARLWSDVELNIPIKIRFTAYLGGVIYREVC